jgi:hypothetical protein
MSRCRFSTHFFSIASCSRSEGSGRYFATGILAATSIRRDSNDSKRGNSIAGGAVSVSWRLCVHVARYRSEGWRHTRVLVLVQASILAQNVDNSGCLDR